VKTAATARAKIDF